jgi:xanthine/CO dehydrogenase XdhC/CoxF family maturation factor
LFTFNTRIPLPSIGQCEGGRIRVALARINPTQAAVLHALDPSETSCYIGLRVCGIAAAYEHRDHRSNNPINTRLNRDVRTWAPDAASAVQSRAAERDGRVDGRRRRVEFPVSSPRSSHSVQARRFSLEDPMNKHKPESLGQEAEEETIFDTIKRWMTRI